MINPLAKEWLEAQTIKSLQNHKEMCSRFPYGVYYLAGQTMALKYPEDIIHLKDVEEILNKKLAPIKE